ncbi:hypothetical protein AMECASPLE_029056 [Ameca splendens]|uniref:Uncharacterized protein n=1 Tax=Ameca splendens TaxID=208324 RepID=A0ABV0XIR6_9TELE
MEFKQQFNMEDSPSPPASSKYSSMRLCSTNQHQVCTSSFDVFFYSSHPSIFSASCISSMDSLQRSIHLTQQFRSSPPTPFFNHQLHFRHSNIPPRLRSLILQGQRISPVSRIKNHRSHCQQS